MSVVSKDEILASIKTVIGDTPSDESITLIENVTDTLSDYEERLSDTTDWKAKYEENDREWKEKYTDRFFIPPADEGDGAPPPADDEPKAPTTFEELFKTE